MFYASRRRDCWMGWSAEVVVKWWCDHDLSLHPLLIIHIESRCSTPSYNLEGGWVGAWEKTALKRSWRMGQGGPRPIKVFLIFPGWCVDLSWLWPLHDSCRFTRHISYFILHMYTFSRASTSITLSLCMVTMVATVTHTESRDAYIFLPPRVRVYVRELIVQPDFLLLWHLTRVTDRPLGTMGRTLQTDERGCAGVGQKKH